MATAIGPWIQLVIAIVLELAGTSLLKLSDGFTKWHWGVAAIILYAICFWVMAGLLRHIPVGVAYAIWSGVGIVGITVIGFVAFGERLTAIQLLCILLILAGAIGLRLATTAS